MSEQMIPVEKINPPAWNSRLTQEDVTGLAQSMESDGQINPITVEGPLPDGTFELVTGSRRLRAAKINGWKLIKADVSEVTDVPTRIIKNVTENQQRQDLTLYEQARACAKLRDEGVKGVDVAKRTGLSAQHVSNLTVMYHHLPTLILTAWQEKHPAATFDFLQSIVRVRNLKEYKTDEAKAERMVLMWTNRVTLQTSFDQAVASISEGETEEEEEEETNGKSKNGKSKTDKNKPFKVSQERFKALSAALKKARIAGAPLALMAIKALVDDEAIIKGVFEPTPEKEERADA